MDTPQAAPLAKPSITLQLIDTPNGVLIRADGDLSDPNGAASVARTLCSFADGLIEGAQLVRLGAEIQAVL
ncbi:MAG: hypothetical protein RL375_775 [Pseudomonadota bacterium]|jgi:hypothetical protein